MHARAWGTVNAQTHLCAPPRGRWGLIGPVRSGPGETQALGPVGVHPLRPALRPSLGPDPFSPSLHFPPATSPGLEAPPPTPTLGPQRGH